MAHTCGNILLHFIFSTDQRRPLIKPEFSGDLHAYIGGIIRELDGTALIVNGTSDHVHILARIRPAHSAAEIMRVVKTNSSKWVRQKGAMNFCWQTGFGVFSVSESNVSGVTQYIANQEEHHRKQSLRDEFIAFLRKNGVDYDEKYLWR